LNAVSIHPQVQVGPKCQGGREGRHTGGAEDNAVETASDGQDLRTRVPQFISIGIDNRKDEWPRTGHRRVRLEQTALICQHGTWRWISNLRERVAGTHTQNEQDKSKRLKELPQAVTF
jgi:hypothetical protein